MNLCFIINGIAESGKDEVYKIFKQYFQHPKYSARIINISTVDKIRYFLEDYGIVEKTDEWRELVSNTKNGIEKINKNAINDNMINMIKNDIEFYWRFNHIFFIHCREPHNIEYLKTELNKFIKTRSMLIYRSDVIGKFNCEKDSIDNVMDFDYDVVIENNDLYEFKHEIIKFCEEIENED